MSSWPSDLTPVGATGWQVKAISWLLDRCPSEFRTYEVFKNHPAALGHVAINHLEYQVESIRDSYRSARNGVRLEPEVLGELLEALEHEGARLALELQSAREVVAALVDTR